MVEVIVASAIFAIVAMSIYQGFASVTTLISLSRDKVAAIDLINSEFELIRNLSYADVGVQNGIPKGALLATSTVVKDGRNFSVTRIIRNIDDPFDGTIVGSPHDLSPADYKMVQIEVVCQSCKNTANFSAVANVSPKNLETASTNGALFVKVFDASGNPVPQANVHITNASLGVNINETTDNNGLLAVVDAPPAPNSYRIVATKEGFTTDRTYATSTGNPNPLKLDATVILQQLTQVSFIIDKYSDINLHTVTNTCAPVSGVPVAINGTKLVGATPDVYKWTGNFTTDSGGVKNIPDVEWDVFSFMTSGGFYLAGTNPISPVSILPNSTQNIDLIISSDSPAFLLVNVKDSSTGLPISGAQVSLGEKTLVTDQGFLRQTDWHGGPGQANLTDPTKFYSSDGNIEINSPAGELKLLNSLGSYVASGEAVSSIFDTGTSSNWSKVDILPADQPLVSGANAVRFQIATAPDNTATTTWKFLGPDATSGSFYTIANNNINPIHNGNRYMRYKIFLSTLNSASTPNISDFAVSFSSSCIPPGQVLFSNLNLQNYSLKVTAPGFVSQTIPVSINSNWQKRDVLLSM